MIPLFKVFMSKGVIKPLEEVLFSGYIGQGKKVTEFENSLQKYLNTTNVITVNSGTSALTLALRLLIKPAKHIETIIENEKQYNLIHEWPGLTKDDEVLTTPLTCTATNWPILINGLKIKWVDVDRKTCNIDLDDLPRKITSKTKVIIVVHWGGYPVDLDLLKEIQLKAKNTVGVKPAIIEDAAHAFGSEYKGKKIGSHGNITCFSFQAIKHLTTGDGGLLVVPHQELYHRGNLLRWYGINRESNRKDFRCEEDICEWGYKFHMNDINATIGLENLSHINCLLRRHRDNALFYNNQLKNVSGVTLMENAPDRSSAYWLYTIKVENQKGFMDAMRDAGIMVSRVHERNDIHSAVAEFKAILPNLDKLVKEMICIPVGWWITNEDRQYIVDTIKKGW